MGSEAAAMAAEERQRRQQQRRQQQRRQQQRRQQQRRQQQRRQQRRQGRSCSSSGSSSGSRAGVATKAGAALAVAVPDCCCWPLLSRTASRSRPGARIQGSPDRYQALPDTSWVHAFVNLMSGELYRRMSLPQGTVTLYLACSAARVGGAVCRHVAGWPAAYQL